jgi:hypothetical protein
VTKKDPGTQFTTQFTCFTSTKVHALEKVQKCDEKGPRYLLALLVQKYTLWKRFKSVTKKDPGTQFTCFASTKVQILTPEPPAPLQFTCFPSTKVLALLVQKYKY